MIVVQTVQENINSKFDNRLWRVDVGISSIFQSKKMEILEILDNGVKLPKNGYKPIRVLRY